jgi:hypothetical protein
MTGVANGELERFYSLLARLGEAPGQGRPIRDLLQHVSLPPRGVYFFLEPGEFRRAYPTAPRIVRVGTHAVSAGSKSTLRGRLKQHLGTRTGGGNHRGSIFRLHVGAALLARDSTSLPTWGIGSSAPLAVRDCEVTQTAEAGCEKRVSEYIGAMSVLWIGVPDEPGSRSDRAFIERNAIALLSNRFAPTDIASETWLGPIELQLLKFGAYRRGTEALPCPTKSCLKPPFLLEVVFCYYSAPGRL